MIGSTGPDGRFALPSNKGAEKLEYVLAYKEGLAPASVLRLEHGREIPVGDTVLVLQPAEPFIGVVQDRDGRVVPGARVRVVNAAAKAESTTTTRSWKTS